MPFQHACRENKYILECYDTSLTPFHEWNHSFCSTAWQNGTIQSIMCIKLAPRNCLIHFSISTYKQEQHTYFGVIWHKFDSISWVESFQILPIMIKWHNTEHPVHQGSAKKLSHQFCYFNMQARLTYIFWSDMTQVWLHLISGSISNSAHYDKMAQHRTSCASR